MGGTTGKMPRHIIPHGALATGISHLRRSSKGDSWLIARSAFPHLPEQDNNSFQVVLGKFLIDLDVPSVAVRTVMVSDSCLDR